MDSFLYAAIKALEHERRPLTTHELVHVAISNGFLQTNGKTPHKTMNARLSEHLLEAKHESLVMRTASGEFGLRSWANKVPEYVAPRRTLNPIEEDILVFPQEVLKNFIKYDGITQADLKTLKKLIEISTVMRRKEAEEDYSVVQLVSSFLITFEDSILTYKRSKRLPEKRLQDAYSLNFGGHITFEDNMPLFGLDEKKFIYMFIRRELDEEVRFMPPPEDIRFKGFLYDSSTQIGRQHIGLVFHVPVKNKNYKIGEKGFLLSDEFEEKNDVLAKIEQFDSWSRMIGKEFINGHW